MIARLKKVIGTSLNLKQWEMEFNESHIWHHCKPNDMEKFKCKKCIAKNTVKDNIYFGIKQGAMRFENICSSQ